MAVQTREARAAAAKAKAEEKAAAKAQAENEATAAKARAEDGAAAQIKDEVADADAEVERLRQELAAREQQVLELLQAATAADPDNPTPWLVSANPWGEVGGPA